MSQSPLTGKPLFINQYSCTVCRQRKVKCDRRQRCSNCTKAGIECVYQTPVRPQHRRRVDHNRPADDILRRLRHCEATLRKHGLDPDDDFDIDGTAHINDMAKLSVMPSTTSHAPRSLPAAQEEKSGSHPNLWSNLSDEILGDFYDEEPPSGQISESSRDIETGVSPGYESMADSHPSPTQIFRLWQKFVENVNPLVRIIHIPTVQRELLEASSNLETVSKPFEALMFAIYSSAITSMNNEECERLTSNSRDFLREKYHKFGQQALSRAGVLGTLNMVVLQANLLLLISLRPDYDPGEFWVLIGIALRIGQRMGLHHDTDAHTRSFLEVQIRRRVWWQIVTLDARCAQRCAADALVSARQWDVSLPLNVSDSDLHMDMTVAPRAHAGHTEMIYCLIMYEIGTFLRRSVAVAPFEGNWQNLLSPAISLPNKDKMIDELEALLEDKYLKYCDPAIPLHTLARSVTKIICSRMRLTTRHPRRYPDRDLSLTAKSKDELFDICLTMVEQDNFLHSMESVEGFLWHVDLGFQIDAFVYLLSELRYRQDQVQEDKAWSEIGKVFINHPQMGFVGSSPLAEAITNLTLRSWEIKEFRCRQLRNEEVEYGTAKPLFIEKLIQQRLQCHEKYLFEPSTGNAAVEMESTQVPNTQQILSDDNKNLDFYPQNDFSMMDMEPIDWDFWNGLILDSETYTIDNAPSRSHDWPA